MLYLYQAVLLSLSIPPRTHDKPVEQLLKPIRPVIRALGIYHVERWYAPDPSRLAHRVIFELDTGAGHRVPWHFEHTDQAYVDRYFLAIMRQSPPQRAQILEDLTRYVERAAHLPPDSSVRILESTATIAPPDGDGPYPEASFGPPKKVYFGKTLETSGSSPSREETLPVQMLDVSPVAPDNEP